MKKIQTTLDTLPEEENHISQRMSSTSDSSFLSKVPLDPIVQSDESPSIHSDVSF